MFGMRESDLMGKSCRKCSATISQKSFSEQA
jgi:hypothetical protein